MHAKSFDTGPRVLPFLKSTCSIGEIGAPPVSQWGKEVARESKSFDNWP